jgi:hypothetical protein
LGPLLFLIFVNDIVIDIDSDIFLYADDTLIMRVITDPLLDTVIMNDDLSLINQWAKQWAVTFSPAKSEQLVITRKLEKANYNPLTLDMTEIKRVTEHCHLGVIFTENFSWETHIRSRIIKAAPTLNALTRSSCIIPREIKQNVYTTLIRPILEYGCMVYDNCPAFISHLLEQSQRTAALVCTGAYKDTSMRQLLREVGWPTLSKRREYYKLCQFYKLVNNISPTYLIDALPACSTDYAYQLRNVHDIRVPRTRTLSYKNSFIPSTIKLWNKLDLCFRNSPSLPTFRQAIKKNLFPKPNPLFLYGRRPAQVHHARIRMGLSALNQQRHKYNYIPDPACTSCGYRQEDPIHYFLECPTYHGARQILFRTVGPLTCDIFPDINDLPNKRAKTHFINILLEGDPRLSSENNKNIFDHVQEYIEDSGRMTRI